MHPFPGNYWEYSTKMRVWRWEIHLKGKAEEVPSDEERFQKDSWVSEPAQTRADQKAPGEKSAKGKINRLPDVL